MFQTLSEQRKRIGRTRHNGLEFSEEEDQEEIWKKTDMEALKGKTWNEVKNWPRIGSNGNQKNFPLSIQESGVRSTLINHMWHRRNCKPRP